MTTTAGNDLYHEKNYEPHASMDEKMTDLAKFMKAHSICMVSTMRNGDWGEEISARCMGLAATVRAVPFFFPPVFLCRWPLADITRALAGHNM